MSAAPGRWRLNVNIDLDIAAGEDGDKVLRAVATRIEEALGERKAHCGRYNFSHIDIVAELPRVLRGKRR